MIGPVYCKEVDTRQGGSARSPSTITTLKHASHDKVAISDFEHLLDVISLDGRVESPSGEHIRHYSNKTTRHDPNQARDRHISRPHSNSSTINAKAVDLSQFIEVFLRNEVFPRYENVGAATCPR